MSLNMMSPLRTSPALLLLVLVHLASAWNYGGGGGGWYDQSKLIVKHIPKHIPVYKPVPIPKPVAVPKPVGYLKPLAIAKPFRVPHVVPVIKHFQKPFPVMKGVPFHFNIPLPKLVKLPFQIKVPKPYVVRVPKPYAVAKKYPVPVPVHIPKPYVVPVLKPYPVGVPHKVPSIVPIVKEVPEYVKKPVPVYIEEKPYKHEYGNYKGTPYIGGGSYKGTPFPSGIGNYKGTPYPSKGTPFPSKGTPFPSGIGEYKGTSYLESLGSGNKGTPYIPSGKGSQLHSKGTSVHATSAQSFLEAHAGKLSVAQSSAGYDNSLASYGQIHGLGGSSHQNHESSGYQLGKLQDYIGTNGNQEYGRGHGSYDLHGLASIGGYDALSVYGRGAEEASKLQDVGNKAVEFGSYESGNAVTGHEINVNTDEKYAEGNKGNQYDKEKQEGDNQGSGYNVPAYLGVSVTSFNDHSGRGGGYSENSGSYENAGNADNHDNQGGYENYGGENKEQQQQGYQGYGASNAEYSAQDNGQNYGHQGQSPHYAQLPQLAVYQIQNGAATAIQYPAPGLQQLYNAGYQVQHGYQNQEENSYANNHVDQGSYGSQGYQQQVEGEEGGYQEHQQQQPHSYAIINAGNLKEAYHNGHEYGQQGAAYGNANQEVQSYGYQNQEGYSKNEEGYSNNQEGYSNNQEGYSSNQEGYQKQEDYGNQDNSNAYHNLASYQVSQNSAGYQNDASYNNQEIAPGLQNYGLRAAYAVQPGADSHNQAQGGTGAVYVRAYGSNQGESQHAAYGVQAQENYQTQDSQQQKSYATFSSTKSSSSLAPSSTQKTEAAIVPPVAASGRSYDSQTSESIVGSSNGYSQPAGDAKGGSWHGVR